MVSRAAATRLNGFVMHRMPFSRSLCSSHAQETSRDIRQGLACRRRQLYSQPRSARAKLATIILQVAVEGECNLLELKCRAIGAMQLPGAA
jgi:hypothetical protein